MKKIILIFLLIPLFSKALTPVFTCGFECGQLGSSGQHWSSVGTVSISTSTVRTGVRSGRTNPTANAASLQLTVNSNIITARFYIYFTTLPNTTTSIIQASNQNCGIYFNSSDNKLYTSGFLVSQQYGATGITVTTGQWYCIDFKTNQSANPILVDGKVDGVSLGQLSLATAAVTTATLYLGPATISTTCDMFYDDVLVSFTSADYPVGEGYVNHFIPTSDGTHAANITTNDFERTLTGTDILNNTTDAYLLLDDVPLESGSGVDWINMVAPVASSYTENIFGPASGISTPTVAPRAVEVIIGIHAAGTGAYNAAWQLNDNGTTNDIFNASAVAGSTTIIYKTKQYASGPAGAWTVVSGAGNFNNIRIRFNSTASVDANPDVYFDCAMIEAEFAPAEAHSRRINWIVKL